MVVHHGVGLEHVGADLVAPRVLGLLLVVLRLLRLALRDGALVQPRLQHLERRRLVLELAALVLALRDDARRQMRDAHRGGRLVDVLAALAGRAEHVDAQVVVLDLDLDVLVDHRVDEHRGERGMAPGLRVERGDPHQPVHALLGLQQPVRVLAPDLDLGGLDAGLVARRGVQHLHGEPVPLGPAHVHPHQHLGPVLRLGAPGARVDRQQRVADIIGTLQQVLQLERFELSRDRGRLRLEPALHFEVHMGVRLHELGQLAPLVHTLAQRVIGLEPALQSLGLLDDGARALRIGPQPAVRHGVLQLGEAARLAIHVKGSSAVPGAGDRMSRNGL